MPEGRWVLPSRNGEEDAMAAPVSRPAQNGRPLGRLWWLPAGGYGNGLDDSAWAPVLEVSEQIIPHVLGVLRDAGVPAYAAPACQASDMLRDRSGRPAGYKLWVGASAYGRAETVLVAAMPSLVREAAGSAWR
jgi:hypothetical protein